MNKNIQVAVVGAGMMGLSMSVLLTCNGIHTLLYVRHNQEKYIKRYQKILDFLREERILTREEQKRCSSYLQVVTSYEELQKVDCVFESASAQLEVKHSIYEALAEHCLHLKAVASSTSAIPSLQLAEGSRIRDKILVAHPFYPPHLVPCVEIVPNKYTSEEAVQYVVDLLKYVRKTPVIIKKDAPGFVANRLQYALLREAIHIVESGIATSEEVDEILMNSFAPRYTSIGIFEHFDNCGLDLARDISEELYPDLADDTEVQKLIMDHCDKKEYGIKTDKGIYDWKKKDVEDFQRRAERPYLQKISWNIPDFYREEEDK